MNKSYLIWGLLIILFAGCEKDVDIDIPLGDEKLVVYGTIETDQPPFIMLTRSLPVFATVSIDEITNSFVNGATISISNGVESVDLVEYCLNDLDESVKAFVEEGLGIGSLDSIEVNFCFYSLDTTDLVAQKMFGQVGGVYSLLIQAEGQTLSSITTIPAPAPLDSLWVDDHPNSDSVDLVRLWAQYTDPAGVSNYVRYYTSRNGEPYYPGYFQSVFDDDLINGIEFEFPLDRGQSRNDEVDFDDRETYGYFARGDSVTVKWASIDQAHFDFWITLEADRNGGDNPFGSPVRILSNINGGLGIWGGYGPSFHTIVIPEL
jgi:hypothetical protein